MQNALAGTLKFLAKKLPPSADSEELNQRRGDTYIFQTSPNKIEFEEEQLVQLLKALENIRQSASKSPDTENQVSENLKSIDSSIKQVKQAIQALAEQDKTLTIKQGGLLNINNAPKEK
jgi:septal ring factor EnvC (AmiA/AmiB activator)